MIVPIYPPEQPPNDRETPAQGVLTAILTEVARAFTEWALQAIKERAEQKRQQTKGEEAEEKNHE
jgi:membrane protein YqaA with SNARE-associated domain